MNEDAQIDSAVAQKGRISIDVVDLKEEIESCRTDVAWSELPLAAKVRVLVKERLEQMRGESQLQQQEQNSFSSPQSKKQTPSPSKSKGDK
jgi:hypothetical protein